MNRHQIARKIAIFFLRSGRGQGLTARITDPMKDILDGTVYLFAIKGLFGLTLPFYFIIILVMAKKAFDPFVAWLDERYLGFWHAENYYSAFELSPYNQELMSEVKGANRELKELREELNLHNKKKNE